MLIDTSGFFSMHDEAEKHHARAVAAFRNSRFRLTTNYVLAEYAALALIRGLPRKKTLAFSREVLADASVEIVWVDEDLHRRAVELMSERADKNYSLCDAASFVLMRKREISEALTTDKHFEQEGFIRLLK